MGRLEQWLGVLERPLDERLLFGVCAAVSRAARLDVTLVRLALVLLTLASGVGLALYLVLWLITPSQGQPSDAIGLTLRVNVEQLPVDLRRIGESLREAWLRREHSAWPRPASRRWVGVGLIAAGLLLLLHSLGLFAWLGPLRLLGLAVIALGASVVFDLTPHWRR